LNPTDPNTDEQSSWYAVKMLFECFITGRPDASKIDDDYTEDKTYEESIYLIHANSLETAYEKAEQEARSYEMSYQNVYRQDVEWKFVRFLDAFHLFDQEPADLTEVYSRHISAPKRTKTEEFVRKMFPETEEQD